jgi:hypothetical protein
LHFVAGDNQPQPFDPGACRGSIWQTNWQKPDRHDRHPQPLPELVSFLETLPEPHILCDRSYRILAANAAYRANRPRGRSHRAQVLRGLPPLPGALRPGGESCPLARSLVSAERVVHLHHTSTGESYENIELSPIRGSDGEIAWFIEKLEPLPGARGLAGTQGLLGRAPAFRHMLELVARVAPSDATVLLQGESGTGKELVAQAIHDASRRSARPFVAVDCSGLRRSSRASSSATSGAPSPAPARARSGWSRRPAAARCSSTSWATSRCRCRSSFCACSKPAPTAGSAAPS